MPGARAGDVARKVNCKEKGGDWKPKLEACIMDDRIEAILDSMECECTWIESGGRDCSCDIKKDGEEVGGVEISEINLTQEIGLRKV